MAVLARHSARFDVLQIQFDALTGSYLAVAGLRIVQVRIVCSTSTTEVLLCPSAMYRQAEPSYFGAWHASHCIFKAPEETLLVHGCITGVYQQDLTQCVRPAGVVNLTCCHKSGQAACPASYTRSHSSSSHRCRYTSAFSTSRSWVHGPGAGHCMAARQRHLLGCDHAFGSAGV